MQCCRHSLLETEADHPLDVHSGGNRGFSCLLFLLHHLIMLISLSDHHDIFSAIKRNQLVKTVDDWSQVDPVSGWTDKRLKIIVPIQVAVCGIIVSF